MANEISGVAATGNTAYAIVIRRGQFFNGTTFEAYSSLNYGNYDIAMTEQGTSGIYFGTFPVLITASGTYEYVVKLQSNPGTYGEDDPIVNSGKIDWTGSSTATASAGSQSGSDWRDYVLRGGFKRTDKDTEIYEETTDAIQEMRRRFMFDEAEIETTTTDTISVLGDFKINVESDFGLLLGVTIEDGQNATPLIKKTKSEFDNIYPDINVTSDRGYPLHFTIYKGQIQIGPIPDQVSYSYRITYSSRAGTITSSTTSVPFTALYRDVLRDNVLSRLYKLMDEYDKSGQLRQSFEFGFDQAVSRERKNSGDGYFNVKPFGM
jgi:hypothetical protein